MENRILNQLAGRKVQAGIQAKKNGDKMTSQERTKHLMRMKTAQQGGKLISAHIHGRVDQITPAWCRAVSKHFPPKIYFAAFFYLGKLFSYPGMLANLLIVNIFIKPGIWFQRLMVRFGCYSEVSAIDGSDYEVNIVIWRWFSKRYECIMDWRSGKIREQKIS